MLERWTRAVVHRRLAVVAFWLGAAVVGAVAMANLPGLLTTSLAVPGASSEKANAVLTKYFGENVEGTFTVVVPVSPQTGATKNPSEHPAAASVADRLSRAARALPGARVSQVLHGDGIVYANVGTSLDLQQAAAQTPRLRRAVAAAGLPLAAVTGPPALQHDITPVLASDLRRGEVIAVLAALVVLLVALGLSWAVLVPFAMAAATTTTTLALVYAVAHAIVMVLYIPNLVQLVGLGLAVDYSLLMVHRFREELVTGETRPGPLDAAGVTRHEPEPVDQAVVRTVATAGKTVLVSGLGVTLGLSVLLLVDVPFVRSLGVAGLLVPLVSMAAAVTLQPALLSFLGRSGTRSLLPRQAPPLPGQGTWRRIGEGVIRHPWRTLAATGALLLAAAAPSAWLQLTPGSVTAVPHNIASWRGLLLLRQRAGPGVIGPVEVVVDAGGPGRAVDPEVDAATLRLADAALSQRDVYVVAVGTRPPYTADHARYRRTVIVQRSDFGAEASQHLVQRLRRQLVPEARFPASADVYVGGAPAQGVDFLSRVYGDFAWVAPGVAVLAYVLLARSFRSLLLPLLAVALDAVTVAASYGLVVVVFRFGAGADLLGLYRVSQVEGWVPVFMFAMLFGLSMDYEVFFVSRMREAWDSGASNSEAVVEGLSRTGRVVSAAAVVMVAALSGMVAGHVAGLQELGVGLALGVLVDATVVRALLMPSVMALLGHWNWWLPGRRLLSAVTLRLHLTTVMAKWSDGRR